MALEPPPDAAAILLVGMPLAWLREPPDRCAQTGTAVLPAGGSGDLPRAAAGTAVLFVVGDARDRPAPAATWGAEFVGVVGAAPGSFPEGLPPSWVEQRSRGSATPVARSRFGDVADDEDDDTSDTEQAFFAVRTVQELPPEQRVHVNELVPKQERGGRTFFPRTPRLVERPT